MDRKCQNEIDELKRIIAEKDTLLAKMEFQLGRKIQILERKNQRLVEKAHEMVCQ